MWTLLSKIHIHPLFWFIIAIGVMTANFKELILLFSIVIIHEMGHVIVAHFFSWRIKKIELLPFGGVAEMDEHGNRPFKEEFIVIMAGPIQHLWMIALSYGLHSLHILNAELHQLFVFHNIVILLFNLLPIWPLDGGKLLFLILSNKMSFQTAHRNALFISSGFLLIMMIAMLLYSPLHLNSWMIISFLIFSIVMEWKQRHFVLIRFLLERYYGKELSIDHLKPIIVDETEKILHVLTRFQRGCKHPIIIQSNEKDAFSLDENELLHAFFTEKRTNQMIGELKYVY